MKKDVKIKRNENSFKKAISVQTPQKIKIKNEQKLNIINWDKIKKIREIKINM